MYKIIIGATTYENISWEDMYKIIIPEFKTPKQKKRFKGFKIVSGMTRELVNDGGCWQPLGHIFITLEK